MKVESASLKSAMTGVLPTFRMKRTDSATKHDPNFNGNGGISIWQMPDSTLTVRGNIDRVSAMDKAIFQSH